MGFGSSRSIHQANFSRCIFKSPWISGVPDGVRMVADYDRYFIPALSLEVARTRYLILFIAPAKVHLCSDDA